MAMHAYPEIYLHRAQGMLGDAFDYGINVFKLQPSEFVSMFLKSSVCKRMELGDFACITGRSGIENAVDIVAEATGEYINVVISERFTRSAEYWCGWAVAYYQWYTCKKYSDIFKIVSIDELLKLYYPLHEGDISKFVDVINKRESF